MESSRVDEISQLKYQIGEYLKSSDISQRIRNILNEVLHSTNGTLQENQIMSALQNAGIVEEIRRAMKSKPSNIPPNTLHLNYNLPEYYGTAKMESTYKTPFPMNSPSLNITVLGGRAFVEQLINMEDFKTSSLFLHLHFRGNRFKTKAAHASVEPAFGDTFVMEFQPKEFTPDQLLTLTSPVHLVLVKKYLNGDCEVIGTHLLEWRKVISVGSFHTSVELIATGAKVPAGVIDLHIELNPQFNNVISESQILQQISMESKREMEALQIFFAFAKSWWREFTEISPSYENRLVKIFAQNEYSGTDLPVCSFVKPLQTGRLIDSPKHAARFVSLLDFEKEDTLGTARSEIWPSIHTFLCKGKGGIANHCILLCSLLLGFGLDAYVCTGTDDRGGYMWVMTKGPTVTFWDSITGHQYLIEGSQTYKFRTIESAFNHKYLYANNQPDMSIQNCIFETENPRHWKSMNQESICKAIYSIAPPLIPSTLQVPATEQEMEISIQSLISEHRSNLGISAIFDEKMSYLLGPALTYYEMERITGLVVNNDDFTQSIKNSVPDNFTFLGYPVHFSHRNPKKMMQTFQKTKGCLNILECRGDQIRFAIRCKIFAYPENVNAVWILIACMYNKIKQ